MNAAPSAGASRVDARRPPWALAWRLAAGQIVAWGILYYTFTVVVGPMQIGTGWSRTFLNTGLSLGLLVWGLCALPVGAWIQRRGGRGLMALAAGVGGVAVALMGMASVPAVYLLAWLLLGAAMAGALYDSAFAVVTAAFGPEYRRGITLITLVAGLASTVFIPIAQFAVDHLGWRGALLTLGLAQIAIGVPLHLLGIPRKSASNVAPANAVIVRERLLAWWRDFRRDLTDPRFVGLAIWFTAHSASFTGLIFQLVPVLQALDVPNAVMLQAIAIIGPMQVLGRFFLSTRGSSFSTLRVGWWAMGGLVAAPLMLLLLPSRMPWLAVFAALFGASNGILTILRGTSIAELFGRERYAELNGAISAPAVFAKAAAPLALAALWSATNRPKLVFAGAVVSGLTGGLGLMIASRARPRPQEADVRA